MVINYNIIAAVVGAVSAAAFFFICFYQSLPLTLQKTTLTLATTIAWSRMKDWNFSPNTHTNKRKWIENEKITC